MSALPKEVFGFLKSLSKNNNREWFNTNKKTYVAAHEQVIQFADDLLDNMRKHDDIATENGKKSLFRIYRDVRFSQDKSPYKNHFSGRFQRLGQQLRGGYYFHLEPGKTMIACGFFDPNKEDLLRIRKELEADASPMRKLLNDKALKNYFGGLAGESLKTAPKGFDKEHPDIDLINYKNFYFVSAFKDEDVLADNFSEEISNRFKVLRPFLNYFSEVLTTDENGLPLY